MVLLQPEAKPDQVEAMLAADCEIASHGLKWIDYKDHSPEDERRDIREAIKMHELVTGSKPQGWYTGRCSVNTVNLVAEQEYATINLIVMLMICPIGKTRHLGATTVPYTLDANDMRFATPQDLTQAIISLPTSKIALMRFIRRVNGAMKMMSIGLHCRLIGRPGRIQGLRKFIDYVKSHDKVWLAKRIDIAKAWQEAYPYQKRFSPAALSKDAFMAYFGSVYEHSPWVADALLMN